MRQAPAIDTDSSPSFNNAEEATDHYLRPLRETLKTLNSKPPSFYHAFTLHKLDLQVRHIFIHLKNMIAHEFSKESPPDQEKLASIQNKALEKSSLIKSFTCDADFYVSALSSTIKKIEKNLIPKENLIKKLKNIEEKLRQKMSLELEKQSPDENICSKILKIQQQYANLGNALTSNQADCYLHDLSHAIQMLQDDKNSFKNAAAKNTFILKLLPLKDVLKEEAQNELSKIEKADINKLDGIKKMASEHLKMLSILCTPGKSIKRKKSAISECHQKCTREAWWKTALKILGIVAIAAAGALVGFVIGHAICPGPGGVAGALIGIFKAAAWGSTVIAATCVTSGGSLLITAGVVKLSSSKASFFVPHRANKFTNEVQIAASNAINAAEEMEVSAAHSVNNTQ